MTGAQGMFMRRDYRPADTSWHEKGVCQNEDEKLFYHPEEERGSTRRARAEAAKAICRECPVRQICREQSLANREAHGTWGGLSEDERGALLAGRPIEGPLHDHPRPEPTAHSKATAKAAAKRGAASGGLVRTCRDIPYNVQRSRVADPRVAAHVRALVEAGKDIFDIADTAGVTRETVRKVARGSETVTRRTAALLLAVQPVERAKAVSA